MNTSKLQDISSKVLLMFKSKEHYYNRLNTNNSIDDEDLKQDAITYTLERINNYDPDRGSSLDDYLFSTMYGRMRNKINRDKHGLTGESYNPEFVYPDQQVATEDDEVDMWDSLRETIVSVEEDNYNLHTILCEDVYVHSPTQTDAEILLHRTGMLGIEMSGRDIARKFELSEASISRSLDLTTSILRKVPRLRQINELYGV